MPEEAGRPGLQEEKPPGSSFFCQSCRGTQHAAWTQRATLSRGAHGSPSREWSPHSPRGPREGAATRRALELQPPSVFAHLSQAPSEGEGPSGAGGLLGEALGAPPQHLSPWGPRCLMRREGPGVGSRKEAGTLQGLEPQPSSARRATTSAFCFFLLIFSQT